MKIILEKVKIYGLDPNIFRTFDDGKKQYSVALYISEEQSNLINSYIYGKCEKTKDDEILFYGKNKNKIPVFDAEKKKIEKPINEVFLADVSILIDEFINDKEETIRYSKCLGIKYVSPVANEAPRIVAKNNYETFDDIFGESENKTELSTAIQKDDISQMFEKQRETTSKPTVDSIYEPTISEDDDLPF